MFYFKYSIAVVILSLIFAVLGVMSFVFQQQVIANSQPFLLVFVCLEAAEFVFTSLKFLDGWKPSVWYDEHFKTLLWNWWGYNSCLGSTSARSRKCSYCISSCCIKAETISAVEVWKISSILYCCNFGCFTRFSLNVVELIIKQVIGVFGGRQNGMSALQKLKII